MNRAERRAAKRGRKGGCTSHAQITFGRRVEDDIPGTILKHAAKMSKKYKEEQINRSKQVPGY